VYYVRLFQTATQPSALACPKAGFELRFGSGSFLVSSACDIALCSYTVLHLALEVELISRPAGFYYS
jgi:hypothetical protein